jgi:hypothetical protein
MSEADVERKFRDMAASRLGAQRCDALLAAIRGIEESNEVRRDLMPLLRNED